MATSSNNVFSDGDSGLPTGENLLSSGSSMSISSGSIDQNNNSSSGSIGSSDSASGVARSLESVSSGSSIHGSNRSVTGVDSPGVDGFQLGDVVKLTHPSKLPCASQRPYSYALYCGNGRVIHSWSSSRTNFRVRVDSLRSLKIAGVTASDATEEMDAFCAKAFDGKPRSSSREIVARARQALHCETRNRRCSVVLIVHARYGDVAIGMAKSLFSVALAVIKLNRLNHFFSTGELSLSNALAVVLHHSDPKNFPMPETPEQDTDDNNTSAAAGVIPTKAGLREKAASVDNVKALLRAEVEPFLAAWMMIAKRTRPDAPVTGVTVAVLASGQAATLFYSSLAQAFTIELTSDQGVLERLVRERMECGICFMNYDVVGAKVLECAHVVCGQCVKQLLVRVCPFCRKPIKFPRNISTHLKAMANEQIRENECQELAANDLDASPPPAARVSTSAATETTALAAAAAVPAMRLALTGGDAWAHAPHATMAAQGKEAEKRECVTMRREDADAPTL